MNQVLGLAIGGSFGAMLRFLVSTGIYQWLGRDFPYGTLAVNLIGSFLLGLLSEALVLQRVVLAVEYRTAILVGFIGAFTTFSTFALETVALMEQGQLAKAFLNIVASVSACLLVVWLGLVTGRLLFAASFGIAEWHGRVVPYGIFTVNSLGALLIGVVAGLLCEKTRLPPEQFVIIVTVVIGAYLTFSGLYVVLFLQEQGLAFALQTRFMLAVFAANTLLCLSAMVLAQWLIKMIPN